MRAFWKKRPPAERPARPATTEAEVREHAEAVVHAGFLDLADAVEQVTEYFDGDGPPTGRVEQIVRAAWAARAVAVGAGSGTDDHARLASAYAALAGDGIIGRMDFTCCQTCGHAEIDDERGPARDERGYTFFHQQDTERIPDGLLYLAYGSFGPEVPEEEVARTVVDRLRAEGLAVAWDGETTSRIEVTVTDWRKPLPA